MMAISSWVTSVDSSLKIDRHSNPTRDELEHAHDRLNSYYLSRGRYLEVMEEKKENIFFVIDKQKILRKLHCIDAKIGPSIF